MNGKDVARDEGMNSTIKITINVFPSERNTMQSMV
jgi:hypothetical protein